ncbi:MAG TPA: hypothetical protein VGV60_08530 [Candidatus Polarisedimenticolia bacterium]|jgi:hypothetical protein|nr:hypothetical protein [Candidatus Polarisedimenticolia bacterium]
MKRRRSALLLALSCGLLRAPEVLAQCAMCGAAAASGKVGRGIAFSVYFLLGILILVVSWFIALIYRAQRHAGHASGEAPPPAGK